MTRYFKLVADALTALYSYTPAQAETLVKGYHNIVQDRFSDHKTPSETAMFINLINEECAV